MWWINLIIGAPLIILGLVIHLGKAHFLISGYNTMRKEKKANIDIERLARLMGVYLYVNGGIFLITGILQAVGLGVTMIPALIFLLVSTVFLVIRAQMYDYNLFDEYGRLRRGAGKKFALPIVILIVSIVLVAVLLVFSAKATEVSLSEEGLEIHGMYGSLYAWEDIEDIHLLEVMPIVELRTNGSALGSKLKGHFRTREFGAVKLFVDADKPPFIYIETPGKPVILNLPEASETNALYEDIKGRT